MRTLAGLLALCAVSLYLRTSTVSLVFQPDFVNFIETDAWYHIRVIDYVVRNFPWRMNFDPYSSIAYSHEIATGPFFDFVIALAAWIAGAGHPSEHLIHTMAAWYPAVVGVLIVPAVFLLGREVFGQRAGWIAAAVAATLPGHFLAVGMVGFTDHHVMETLLSTLFFWLLIRAIVKPGFRTLLAGLGLGAYLLTFVGGAFLVAVVTVWVVFEQIRFQWPRKETAPIAMPVIQIFLIALVMVAPFYQTFWMGYTIAALAGGAVSLAAMERIVRMTKSRVAFFGVFIAACAVVIGILLVTAPQQMRIVTRLMPWFSGQSGGVAELDSLFVRDGAFTLARQWNQFGGALVLAAAAIVVLGEMAVARPEFRRNLIFFWSLVTMLMAIGQVRMTYYFGAAAALLVGFLTDRLLRTRSFIRWGAGIAVAGLVLAPNLIHAFATGPSESPDVDWLESLAWLREKTPEPFGNPDYYYGPYHSPAPDAAYSVMSWWDYGYWIMALGRRVPVTNPTQINATAAAQFLLAQNESEAAQILEKWRSRYVLLDRQLVMSADAQSITGKFPNFFFYDQDVSPDDYYLIVRAQDGSNRVLYRPAYFQSMLVHLFVFGGDAVERPAGVALAFLHSDGKKFELTDQREYPSEQQALAAEAGCRLQGCLIVSASPIVSCVHLDSLHRFRPAFSSSTKVLRNEQGFRASAVQIYEVK